LERASADMLPIIESLFGEITILGFLSVITFICTKVGVLELMSGRIFGTEKESKEKLTEIFETGKVKLRATLLHSIH